MAFGVKPHHTFTGTGIYSGQLTVTDIVGNHAAQAFSVTITNLAPAVNAGPDTTSAWGRQVAFNGSATDPGGDDQSTLSYAWDFGDGSPSATGGPSVTHAYSTPGDYTAIFSSCDKWNACSSDSRIVHVRTRHTTIGYLGDHSGTFATSANFSASLVDEFNQTISGRVVNLTVGAENEGSPSTNSSGLASTSHVLGLAAGSYTATAAFGGDSLYDAADAEHGRVHGRPESHVRDVHRLAHRRPEQGHHPERQAGRRDQHGTRRQDHRLPARKPVRIRSHRWKRRGIHHAQAHPEERYVHRHGDLHPTGGDIAKYLGSATSNTFKLQAK